MTIGDDAGEESVGADLRAPSDQVDVVHAESQEVDFSIDDAVRQLSSAILEGGGAFDSTNLAVLAQMSGPLPPPLMLRDYDEIIPDGANRMMVMAETTQGAIIADRREGRKAERRGQVFAFICVLAVLATGIVLALLGQEVTGSILSAVGLTAMVYAFVHKAQSTQAG